MLKKVFEPIQIGSMTLKNRLVVPAMASNYSDEAGMATEQLIGYHEAKAKGGWGLIIVEDYRICPGAGASAKLPGLWDDSQIASHRELTERVHKAGGTIVAQIYHAGWDSKRSFVGECPKGVVPVKNIDMEEMPEELTIPQLETIIRQFGECAARAKQAGFDGVEIHGAHGYLLEQFFSPQLNARSDAYGGDFEGRARLAVEVVRSVRAAVGPDYPILYRMTASEPVPGGLGMEESKALAILLEDAGVNAIHVSQGSGRMGAGVQTISPSAIRPGSYGDNAAAIRSVVEIPVIAVGRVNTPEIAESMIRSGKCDMVAMGRASIADPELPNKAKEGRLSEINHCIGCVQGCIGEKRKGNPLSCMVNPTVGHETEWNFAPAKEPKKVYIAGGGVSGCETAIAAAQRGHQVTLFEKANKLGGQWLLAAVPVGKTEFSAFVKWQTQELNRLGVTIRLQEELTKETILADKPDVVIDATGSHPFVPPIKGADCEEIRFVSDILSGKVSAGKNVVVIGGGLAGAETAEYLAYHGSKVTILEALPQIAKDGEGSSNAIMMKNLKDYNADIFVSAKVLEIGNRSVQFEWQDETYTLSDVDTIIMATGSRGNTEFADAMKEAGIDFIQAGDSVRAKNGLANIRQAYEIGMSI